MTGTGAVIEPARLIDHVVISSGGRLPTGPETLKSLTYKQPPLADLKKPILPNQCLTSIWVNFVDRHENSYTAVVVPQNPNGPYILLSSEDKEAPKSLAHTAGKLRSFFGGRVDKDIYTRADDITLMIRLRRTPSQEQIANFVSNPPRGINDAKVSAMHFHDVPAVKYLEAGFPLESLFPK